MKKNIIFIPILLFSIFMFACQEKDKPNDTQNNNNTQDINTKALAIKLDASTADSSKFAVGKDVIIKMETADSVEIDSAILYINDEKVADFTVNSFEYNWNSQKTKVGTNKFRVMLYYQGTNQRKEIEKFFLSDIEPKQRTYKIINTYNHQKDAYTQGLFYHQGALYEATGLKGASSIRKTKLETGEILQSFSISGDIFGEGITLFDGKIIQLSWRANKGFVYDFETFEKISEFSYPTEGWGLTNDGKNLIMSDGTHILYVLETQSYSTIRKIEVCDNTGIVNNLNELEYINGEIYANIYGSDLIAKISPETGKVLEYINLSNILDPKFIDSETDVLNGIAYDAENERLFVTGKKWVKLFEIEIL